MRHLTDPAARAAPYFSPGPSEGPTPTLDEYLAFTGGDPLDPDGFPADPASALAELRARADAENLLAELDTLDLQ